MTIRILVVQGSEIETTVFQRLVNTSQHTCACVFSQTMADAMFQLATPFDLVFTDHRLPDGDGFAILNAATNTSVIFMAQTGDETSVVKAMAAGAADYIIKDPLHAYNVLLPIVIERVIAARSAMQTVSASCNAEARYRRIVDEQTELVCRYDANLAITFANSAYCVFAGYPSEQAILGRSILENISPEKHIEVKNKVALLTGKDPFVSSIVHQAFKSDQTMHWLAWQDRAIVDTHGKIVEYQAVGRDITRQKEAEQALEDVNNLLEHRVEARTAELAQIKDRLEAIFNHSADCLLLISVTDGIQQANRAFETHFGIAVDSSIGKNLSAFVQPGDAALIDRVIQEIPETRQTCQIEVRAKRADGTVFEVEMNITPVNRSESTVTHLVCIIHDISEHKQTDRVRRESETMLHNVLENIPVQIFWKDRQSVYQGCNSLFARNNGLETPGQVIGLTDHDLVPEFAEEWETDDRDTIASGQPKLNVEGLIREGDGQERWLRSNKVALRDSSGQIIGVLATLEDITASKQAELAIAEERNRLRVLIDTIPDFIYFKDIEHRIMLNNIAHTKSLGGRSWSEVAGKTDFDLFPPDMAVKFWDDEEQLFRTQLPIVNTEERSIGQDGRAIWALTTKMPLHNLNGELIGLVGITHDISHMKASEEALRESQKMLRVILDTIPVRVFWKDHNSVLQGCNRLFVQDAGFDSIDSLLGKSGHELPTVAIEEDQFRADDRAVMESGVAKLDYEETLTLPNHQSMVVQTSKLPLRNDHGEIIGVLGIYTDISTRKTIEQQLRYLASLQEHMYDAVIGTDLSFHIQSWNKAAERLYGWSAAEVIGKKLGEITHAAVIGETLEESTRALMASGTWTGEAIQQHRNGDMVHVLGSIVVHKDENGIPIGIIGVNRDITDRKKTETALAQAYQAQSQMQVYLKALHEITLVLTHAETLDEFYRCVVEQALAHFDFERIGLLLLDPKTEKAQGTYGTDLKGAIVDEHNLLLEPDQINSVMKRILNRNERFVFDPEAQLFDNETPLRIGHHAVAALWDDQILGWISVDNAIQYKPISEAQLEILALYASTVGSLLARKWTELKLLALSQRLDLATQAGDIGIWDWDLIHDSLLWDDRMYRLYGVNARDFPGNSAIRARVIHPDDLSRLNGEIQAVLLGQKDYDIEFRALWPDKSEHYIKAKGTMLRSPEGVPERLIGVNLDITDIKRAEIALRTALEKQQELNNLKSQFVSMVSHEFRTPLAVILSTAETLSAYRSELNDTQIDARLDKIKIQVDYMKGIMEDLLDLARLQAGKNLEFKPASIDLDSLCLDIIAEFESQPRYKGRLVYRCDTKPCFAYCDARLIRQVFSNLISNSLKYSAEGKPAAITLGRQASEITFTVSDQGIGIPSQDLVNIFEPFTRASNVGTISGTGLGLSIIKKAVDMHHGVVSIDSEVDVGSTFTVTFPYGLND